MIFKALKLHFTKSIIFQFSTTKNFFVYQIDLCTKYPTRNRVTKSRADFIQPRVEARIRRGRARRTRLIGLHISSIF